MPPEDRHAAAAPAAALPLLQLVVGGGGQAPLLCCVPLLLLRLQVRSWYTIAGTQLQPEAASAAALHAPAAPVCSGPVPKEDSGRWQEAAAVAAAGVRDMPPSAAARCATGPA
jgi:hypothetical protein